MMYDFTPLCLVRFISGILAIALFFILWNRRKAAGAFYLILFELFAAIWAVSDGFEAAATTVQLKLLWSAIGYIGITNSAVMFFLFSLGYTQSYRVPRSRVKYLLFLIPVITILLAFTNQLHRLVWSDIVILPGTNQSVYYYGAWFWVNITYQYTLLVSGMIILLIGTFRTFSIFRIQMWLLLLSVLLPFLTSISYVFKLLPVKGIDFTPIAFIFTGIIIGLSVFRLGFFDLIPIAQKQAIDNLQDGLLVIDHGNTIVNCNSAFLGIPGIKNRQIIGTDIDEVLSQLNLKISDFSDKTEFMVLFSVENEGEMRHYEARLQQLKDNRNNIIGSMLIVHDVTLNKMILDTIADSNNSKKTELEEKQKLIMDLEAYARSVAHDLKNPVSSIISLAELLRISLAENDYKETGAIVEMIQSQGETANTIIQDLLILSRIRKEDIKVVPIDIGKAIDGAVSRLTDLIKKTGATIEKPGIWPSVYGHPQWVEQIWINLISNALKYGGRPPIIKIDFEQASENIVKFLIKDNGAGLPPASLAKLFNDFERLDKKDIDGHGLGLSIIKRILNKLGGEINVESTNKPGEGCTFSFTLKNA
jgi:PAS domain S-box-containing protein